MKVATIRIINLSRIAQYFSQLGLEPSESQTYYMHPNTQYSQRGVRFKSEFFPKPLTYMFELLTNNEIVKKANKKIKFKAIRSVLIILNLPLIRLVTNP